MHECGVGTFKTNNIKLCSSHLCKAPTILRRFFTVFLGGEIQIIFGQRIKIQETDEIKLNKN